MDIVEVDSIYDVKNENNIDGDYLNRVKDIIEGQYIDFNNLGINMIDKIELKYQLLLLDDFFEYVHKNYTPMINYAEAMITPNVKYIIGHKVYQFISCDFYLTIFPSLLEDINVNSFEGFYKYVEFNSNDNYQHLKMTIIKCIKKIYDNIKKLDTIDKNIVKDRSFKELLDKYSFYIKLINFGNIDNFVNNFCLPMFEMNEDEIIWKLS